MVVVDVTEWGATRVEARRGRSVLGFDSDYRKVRACMCGLCAAAMGIVEGLWGWWRWR